MIPTSLLSLVVVAMVTASESGHPDHPPEQIYIKSSNEASDDLKANWRIIFRVLDVNHDGVVNKKDAEDSRSQYGFLTALRDELDTDLAEKLDQWWTEFVFRHAPEMTQSQYVDAMNNLYILNKDDFASTNTRMTNLIFEVQDTNHDKHLSWEEFATGNTMFGLTGIAKDYAAFLSYKPAALVPVSRFVDAWAGLCNEVDDSSSTVVRDSLAKDGYE